MNKKLLLSVATVGLVLAGCKQGANQAATSTGNTPQQATESAPKADNKGKSFVGSLKDAIAQAVPMKCTFKDKDVEGTSYVNGKQMYSEMTASGKTSSIIVKDDCMWTWANGEKQGFKFCYKPEESQKLWDDINSNTPAKGSAKMPSGAEYNCSPGLADNSKFTPPADVNFASLDDMMKGLKLPSIPPQSQPEE
jgi:hypothetical protein